MKISDLKQPYRRITEYLGDENNTISHSLSNYFFRFYNKMHKGHNPPITEEIKKHFPPDFDFSGEDEYPNNQCDDACYYHCTEGGNIKPKCINERYTKLAKEGKFDQLPDTCEFSEAVELEVWDNELMDPVDTNVLGKFKGLYITEANLCWKYAKLPAKKIDFSEFKSGDVVEVELSNEEKRIGWFDYTNNNHLYIRILQRKGNQICNGGSCAGTKIINKEKIKSITKIK